MVFVLHICNWALGREYDAVCILLVRRTSDFGQENKERVRWVYIRRSLPTLCFFIFLVSAARACAYIVSNLGCDLRFFSDILVRFWV